MHDLSGSSFRRALARVVACGVPPMLVLSCSNSPEEAPYPEIGGSPAQLVEELRIDGNREDLVPIFAVAVSDGGTIALIQSQDGAIRLFSSAGEPMGSFGRTGDGPGEFRLPSGIGWQGDTVWVLDLRTPRVTYVARDLSRARTEGFPQAPVDEDGGILAVFSPHRRDPPSPYTNFGTLGYLDRRGAIRNVILPLHEDRTPGPIRNRTMYAMTPKAGRAAVASATLNGPGGGTFSLVAVDLAGDTVVARRYALEGESIPPSVADSLAEAFPRMRLGDTGRRRASDADIPPVYPPLLGLLVGYDGSFWVRARLRDGSRAYLVLAPNGDPVGRVRLPEGSIVGAATLDRIWVLEPDLFGIQSVVRYRVEWS